MNLKAKSIVGRPQWPTRKLINFVDRALKSFLKNIPRFIKDSLDS